MHCMNTDGSDFWGRPYTPESPVLVRPGAVLPLWIAVAVDEAQPDGVYSGDVTIVFEGGSTATVGVNLTISGPSLGATHGDAEQWRGTRLAWLDSDIAVSGDTVPPPFTPLTVTQAVPMAGFGVTMLDKSIKIDATGMIASATVGTHATAPGNPNYENAVVATPLSAPFEILVDGSVATPAAGGLVDVYQVSKMDAKWSARATTHAADVKVNGSVDATGFSDFAVTITPTGSVPAGGANLSIDLRLNADPSNTLMMMGLGAPGGCVLAFARARVPVHESPPRAPRARVCARVLGLYLLCSLSCLYCTSPISPPWCPRARIHRRCAGRTLTMTQLWHFSRCALATSTRTCSHALSTTLARTATHTPFSVPQVHR